ncbi:MAG: 7-cyano-7-deazaguanine synthase [Leptospiraceae bacterium]|nr:MAG: 7-cyano-7-deazaguanine synthase [Leptospiraceae bacterium]
MKESAIVLLSGGIDSVTTLYYANQQYELYALTFDYGQKHKYELELAKYHTRHLNAKEHLIVTIQSEIFKKTALVDKNLKVPENRTIDDEIPITYVPARNLLFLSYGVAFAESRDIKHIFIGANALDYSGYPDCRPEFISSFEKTANLGTKMGVLGNTLKIHAPLINKKKFEIIKLGLELGVDYSLTSSCYQADSQGKPCLKCDSCQIRIKGFKELGIEDPLIKKFNLLF